MSSKVLFTSDTHFFHKAVIDYCDRPFRTLDGQLDVEAMNAALVDNWNAAVAPGDTVYHLGDFAMGPREHLAPTRAKLNGRIVLIKGNHDRSKSAMLEAGFDEVYNSLTLPGQGVTVYLRHIPPKEHDDHEFGRMYDARLTREPNEYYDYFLCGHVHTAWRRRGNVINVGVDVWGYRPVRLEELLAATDEASDTTDKNAVNDESIGQV